ncbi:MAG: HigA family addiction module antitoxin [Erysipelotrichaceae bacterium]
MTNYIEFKEKIAFHPGYYIKEYIDESGLTQEDFAKRLDTTPKNLSLLIRGQQSLSNDIAMKLSRMLNTSIGYWLNLQNAYDILIAEFNSEKELEEERIVFQNIDYKYFRENFGLPNLPRKIDEQIKCVREFLNVSTLTVFLNKDMTVSFRSTSDIISESSTIKANIMVQIAINETLKQNSPKFNKKKFESAIEYVIGLTSDHENFYSLAKKAFYDAGVVFIVLPNIGGSKTNGAIKKVGKSILLMVNDRRLNADTFWFTLFHEIGHINNGDFGISFEKETGLKEQMANDFAKNILIPLDRYQEFVERNSFELTDIKLFAKQIGRDPGIVLGRLQNEGIIAYDDWRMKDLRHKYKVAKNIEYEN